MQKENEIYPEIWSEVLPFVGGRKDFSSVSSVSKSAQTGKKLFSQREQWSFANTKGRYYNNIYLSHVERLLLQQFVNQEKMMLTCYQASLNLAISVYSNEKLQLLNGAIVVIMDGNSDPFGLIESLQRINSNIPIKIWSNNRAVKTDWNIVPGIHIVLSEIWTKFKTNADFTHIHTVITANLIQYGSRHIIRIKDPDINVFRIWTKHLYALDIREEISPVYFRRVNVEKRGMLYTELENAITKSPGRVFVKKDVSYFSLALEGGIQRDFQKWNEILEDDSRVASFKGVKRPTYELVRHFDSFVVFIEDRTYGSTREFVPFIKELVSLCMRSSKKKHITLVSYEKDYVGFVPLPSKILLEAKEKGLELKEDFPLYGGKSICDMSYAQLLVAVSGYNFDDGIFLIEKTLNQRLNLEFETVYEENSDDSEEYNYNTYDIIIRTDTYMYQDCWIILDPLDELIDKPKYIGI